jgi:hypothetical protein
LLRQGDLFFVDPIGAAGVVIDLDANSNATVAILSQTCDALQASKPNCLVAPVLQDPSSETISAALKGRRPLLLYLADDGTGRGPWLADLGTALSMPKSQLHASRRVARTVGLASSSEARLLGARIGRAFSRFPFPDGVHPVFTKVQEKLRSRAGTSGNLGKVIDLLEDVRISANHWEGNLRELTLYLVVGAHYLIPSEDEDPGWQWDRVTGVRVSDTPDALSIDRVCELILANLAGDRTTLARLWAAFGASLHRNLIEPQLGVEVVSVDVVVVSDTEFSHKDMRETDSLDLETLSDASA